jgi:integrase
MKAKLASVPRKPVEIKRGNVTVKIYSGANRVADKVYPQFTLVYYDGSQRKKVRFADLGEAKREAELVATKLANRENEVLRLTSTDRAVYVQAVALLRPLDVPLNVAVLEYVSTLKGLPEGATLKEVVDFFKKRNPASLEKRTVQQVVDEMLATKRAAKLSEVHLKDLRSRLDRFAEDFKMPIGGVSSSMLQTWLDGMEVSGRTKQNYMRVIGALFRFGSARRYLPKDAIEEVKAVRQAKADNSEIEIFTPAEFAEILNTARAEMVPWLAIGGLAGLRSAELGRLDWSEVNLAERHIEIKASKAKTAARRLAPITDNLAAWLAPYAKPAGKVTGFESWWNQIPKLVEEMNRVRHERGNTAKFVWKHNGLRHSFCSYRLASIKNAAQVALEAGNSPQMIFKHYRQLVTESEAGKWFSVQPQAAQNVVRLNKEAAA